MTIPAGHRARLARILPVPALVCGVLGASPATGDAPLARGSEEAASVLIEPDRATVGPLGWSELESAQRMPDAFPLRPLWKRPLPRETVFSFRQAERSTPQMIDGMLWLGSSRTRDLLGFDPRSGWLRRRILTRGTIEAPIVQDSASGDLIVADTQGYVTRFRQDGTKLWEHGTPGPVLAAPGIGDGRVFFHAIDGSLVALNLETGAPLWTYRHDELEGDELAIFGTSTPRVVGSRVITGTEDGRVVALRTDDGSLAWEYRLSTEGGWQDVDGEPVQVDSDLVVISAYKGATVCLRVETGEQVWREARGSTSHALLRDGKLYLPDPDGYLVSLDARTGSRLWRWQLPDNGIPHRPSWWRGKLLLPTAEGRLFGLNPESGELEWELAVEDLLLGFSGPVSVSEDAIVFGVTDGGWLYAWSELGYQPPPSDTRRSEYSWSR